MKKTVFYLTLTLTIFLAGLVPVCAGSADCVGSWQTKASGSLARRNPAVAAVNSILYAAGGAAPNSTGSVNSFEAYDPISDHWTVKPALPVSTQGGRAAGIDGLLYVVGGGTASNPLATLQVFNPANNSWAVKTSMPTPRYYPGAAALGGLLYVVGGTSGHGALYSTLEVYNPATDSWTTKAPMPQPRSGVALVAVNGLIYAIGGGNDAGYVSTVYAYNPVANTWTQKASLPTPMASTAVGAINEIIYVLGGDNASGALQSVEQYDTIADSWNLNTAMPTLQNVMGAGVVGENILVARCVYPAYPNSSVLTIEAFHLTCPPPIQDVGLYIVEKDAWFTQTSSTSVSPAVQSPGQFNRAVPGPFSFFSEVTILPDGGVSSATLTKPGGVSGEPLQPAPSALALTPAFQSKSDLDANFPNGTYRLKMVTAHNGTLDVPLNLAGERYPTTPRFSNYDAAGSALANADFTLSWDPFANGSPGDAMFLRIYDQANGVVYESPLLSFDATSATIPANTLAPATQYQAQILFFAATQFDSTSYPGAFGIAEYASITTMRLTTFSPVVTPMPPGTINIATTAQKEFGLSAAFDGVNYLVAFQGGPNGADEVSAQFISADGKLVGSRIAVGGAGSLPLVRFDGNNFLVVWATGTADPDLYGQFISRSGALVRSQFVISAVPGRQRFDSPEPLVFDGANYFLVWRDERNNGDFIYGQFISPAGTLVGTEVLISDANGSAEPAVAFDGDKFMVAWQTRRTGDTELHDVYGRFLSRSGAALSSPFLISQAPSKSHNPMSVAFDGANFFVLWPRDIGAGFPAPTDWDLYARTLTKNGTFLGPEFPVTTAPGSQPFGSALYSPLAQAFMVSWFDQPTASVRTRFFSVAGAPVSREVSRFGPRADKGPVAIVAPGANGKGLMVVSYVDQNFRGEDLYGMILDLAPAESQKVGVRQSNNNVEIFWPATGLNYVLETSTTLGSSSSWQNAADQGAFNGSEFISIPAATGATRFYRLRLN